MNQELAYTEIEKLITNFKNMPAAQRKGLNEMNAAWVYFATVQGSWLGHKQYQRSQPRRKSIAWLGGFFFSCWQCSALLLGNEKSE